MVKSSKLAGTSAAAAALLALIITGCATTSVREEAPPIPSVGPRLRVAVVEFENKTTYGSRLGTAAADILVTELGKTDRFILIERTKLAKLFEEQKLGMTGAVDADTAARMGRVLGAAAIVTGAVTQFGVQTKGTDMLITESKQQVADAVVDVRVIDVETSQILYAESGEGRAETKTGTFLGLGSSASYNEAMEGNALRAAITSLAANLTVRLSKIPWTCRVADLDGETIYLDAGLRSGLAIGTELDVIRLGAEIKSPATGVVIGRRESRIGKAKIVQHFGEDGSVAMMTEGSRPGRGDLMRMPGP